MRPSAVTAVADVVLPIAAAAEKAGSYLNWEGRRREFATTITSGNATAQAALPDCRVLDSLAVEMDFDLFTQTPAASAGDFTALGRYRRAEAPAPEVAAQPAPAPAGGKVLLATWRRLLDNGSLQDGEPHLAGTARPAVALLSATTADELQLRPGRQVKVSTSRGSVTLPLAIADLPDGVVWLPGNSGPATVRRSLGVGHGAEVTVANVAGVRPTQSSYKPWGGRT
jgi:NADH-quinone oxidoreductase subunit G